MKEYREILRLHHQGISGRNIASSCGCSRNTVAKVLEKASGSGVTWATAEGMTNGELREQLFPAESFPSLRKRPDCEHVHKELAKSGVTLSLLWQKYCESCRQNNEIPLMYSQFCYWYQHYAMTKKATMHVTRKPGETAEVDWAGQKVFFLDPQHGRTDRSLHICRCSFQQPVCLRRGLSPSGPGELDNRPHEHVPLFRRSTPDTGAGQPQDGSDESGQI